MGATLGVGSPHGDGSSVPPSEAMCFAMSKMWSLDVCVKALL